MITKRGKKCLAIIFAAALTLEPLATQVIFAAGDSTASEWNSSYSAGCRY